MKKYIILILLATPLPASAAFDYNLSYGQASQSVLELQDFLYDQGCFPVQPTGYFGSITLRAVKCFQAKNGIIQTGYFGPLSRAKANSILVALTPVGGGDTEASTSPQDAPGSVLPLIQYIYLPTQEPHINIMPTITGQLPLIFLSDNGANLSDFNFTYEGPADFSGVVASVERQDIYGKKPSTRYNVSFSGWPEGNWKVKIGVSADNYTDATTAAYFERIENEDGTLDHYAWRNE